MLINKLWKSDPAYRGRRHRDPWRPGRKLWAATATAETHLASEIDSNFPRENSNDSLTSRRQNITPVLGLAPRCKPLSHRDKSSGVKLIRHCSRSIYSENISPLILCLGSRRMNQLFSADGASCDSKKTHKAPIRTTTNWSRQ